MPSREPEEFITAFADAAADVRRQCFSWQFGKFSARCESPIERVMAAALLFAFNHSCTLGSNDEGWFTDEEYRWPDAGGHAGYSGLTVYSQAAVGAYRADFLLRVRWLGEQRFIVIECDGHDFHERTKEQAERDRSRDRWMISQGITVLRFTGAEIWRDPAAKANEVVSIFYDVASAIWAKGAAE